MSDLEEAALKWARARQGFLNGYVHGDHTQNRPLLEALSNTENDLYALALEKKPE